MRLSWRESAGILVASGAMVLVGCGGSMSSLQNKDPGSGGAGAGRGVRRPAARDRHDAATL